MRKRDMKIGMKVTDLEFKWGVGVIIEVDTGVVVKFERNPYGKGETSYSPAEYKFLKKVE